MNETSNDDPIDNIPFQFDKVAESFFLKFLGIAVFIGALGLTAHFKGVPSETIIPWMLLGVPLSGIASLVILVVTAHKKNPDKDMLAENREEDEKSIKQHKKGLIKVVAIALIGLAWFLPPSEDGKERLSRADAASNLSSIAHLLDMYANDQNIMSLFFP